MEVRELSIQVIWTPKRCEEFIRLADLEGLEAEIIKIRHKRYGRIKDCDIIAEKGYAISPDTYDKTIRKLKHMYDRVQPDSNILPPRQFTVKDAYRVSADF